MGFGERLRERRLKMGLTQEQLGKIIGVSKSVISYYELGERAPSPEVLLEFAEFFGISTDQLLGRKGITMISADGLTESDIDAVNTLIDHLRNKNGRIKNGGKTNR